jgi:hypothetical protein
MMKMIYEAIQRVASEIAGTAETSEVPEHFPFTLSSSAENDQHASEKGIQSKESL